MEVLINTQTDERWKLSWEALRLVRMLNDRRNWPKVIEKLNSLAYVDQSGLVILGICCIKGIGTVKDFRKGVKCLKRAARMHDALARDILQIYKEPENTDHNGLELVALQTRLPLFIAFASTYIGHSDLLTSVAHTMRRNPLFNPQFTPFNSMDLARKRLAEMYHGKIPISDVLTCDFLFKATGNIPRFFEILAHGISFHSLELPYEWGCDPKFMMSLGGLVAHKLSIEKFDIHRQTPDLLLDVQSLHNLMNVEKIKLWVLHVSDINYLLPLLFPVRGSKLRTVTINVKKEIPNVSQMSMEIVKAACLSSTIRFRIYEFAGCGSQSWKNLVFESPRIKHHLERVQMVAHILRTFMTPQFPLMLVNQIIILHWSLFKIYETKKRYGPFLSSKKRKHHPEEHKE